MKLLRKKGYVSKYSVFSFSLLSKGVIILYFESEEEMRRAVKELRDYVDDKPPKDKWFYDKFVNVDWIGGFNYRRGCPEFDKFGDWRNWKK